MPKAPPSKALNTNGQLLQNLDTDGSWGLWRDKVPYPRKRQWSYSKRNMNRTQSPGKRCEMRGKGSG